jgi:hypothetical protein
MPALFAYLLAVGLLLGGGYGALSWLAAPEPVKVVAKAKPKPPPRDEASSEATSFEPSSLAHNNSEQAPSGSNDPPSPIRSEASVATSEHGAHSTSSEPSPVQQTRETRADAEIATAEAKQEVSQPALAVLAASTDNAQAAATSPRTVAATTARPMKRPHARPASGGHSQKSRLALMTLRTIEFPDGRRVTQLIPYRNGGRLLAFQPDD